MGSFYKINNNLLEYLKHDFLMHLVNIQIYLKQRNKNKIRINKYNNIGIHSKIRINKLNKKIKVD